MNSTLTFPQLFGLLLSSGVIVAFVWACVQARKHGFPDDDVESGADVSGWGTGGEGEEK